jgi:hypothetical protein
MVVGLVCGVGVGFLSGGADIMCPVRCSGAESVVMMRANYCSALDAAGTGVV